MGWEYAAVRRVAVSMMRREARERGIGGVVEGGRWTFIRNCFGFCIWTETDIILCCNKDNLVLSDYH